MSIRNLLRLLLFLCLSGSLLSYSPESYSIEKLTVRVGVYQNAPKIYRNDAGQPAGLFIELIKAIARRENWHLKYVDCEWNDCLTQLEQGSIDLMPDMAFSESRNRKFDFHHIPVTHSWSVLSTRKDKPVASLAELDHQPIALLNGSVQTGPLEKMFAGLGLHYTPVAFADYQQAFEAVRDGDAAAVVSNSYYSAFYDHQYALQETPIVFNPVALYYATTRGDPLGLLNAIDSHLQSWRYDEHSVYYDALRKAMVPAQEPVVPPTVRYAFIGFGGLLLLFLAMSALLRIQVRLKTGQLHEMAQRLDHMLNASPVVLYQLSLENGQPGTRWVSDNIKRLFGFAAPRFIRENLWSSRLHPDDREAVLNNLAVLPQQGHLVQEYRILDKHGKTRVVRDEMTYLAGEDGQADEIVGCWNDLTESRAQADQLRFLTHYDPLTRLANRALLMERLQHALYQAQREKRSLAVLYIDIDRFKHINDGLGLAVGNAILRSVANRLSQLLRTEDVLARIGGNGFVMLLEESASRGEAISMARAIIQSFVEPVRIKDHEVALTLSTGISQYPGDADDADSLLQHAEAAMYEAKHAGRNLYRCYSSTLSAGKHDRLMLETALRGAVEQGQLVLHYQPQVDLESGCLVGAEALVRWQHPELGLVSPARFIPIAEEMGIISDIGAWVIEEACRQMVAWRNRDFMVPRVAVNLSVQQIDTDTLIPLVRDILERTGLDPSALELEVTESLIMREPERSTLALEGFREMGIQLSIDDFGTGYSSLSYLKHLPIHSLKIDQSFVRDIGRDSNSEAISRAVIGLARSLELTTVAEGIEEEHQLAFLRHEGCAVGQGYLFSHPVPGDELVAFRTPGTDLAPTDYRLNRQD